jgi:hypothetical protein
MIKEKRKLEAERAELLKAFKAGDTSATAKLKAIMAPINALNKKLGV